MSRGEPAADHDVVSGNGRIEPTADPLEAIAARAELSAAVADSAAEASRRPVLRIAPEPAPGPGVCSVPGCGCNAIQQVDLADVVVDASADMQPVRLCAEHSFERLAAKSRTRLPG